MILLQSRAYSVAEFDETSQSANRLLALASGPRSKFVRTIRFAPHEPQHDWSYIEMPKLTSLELGFYNIGSRLVEFLSRHEATLERTSLAYCVGFMKCD